MLNNKYSINFEDVDFIPPNASEEGSTVYYTYEMIEANKDGFKARAIAINDSDGDGVKSTWEIDQKGIPKEIIKD